MTPRAVRLAGDCPKCNAPIVVRKRRVDGERFISCTRYPNCKWAGDYDAVLNELDAAITRLEQQARRGSSDARGVDVARELKSITALAHPDRWPGALELAHEVTVRINALRDKIS